ncbi:MAG: DUF488 family protein, partial [Enterocloster sp.]
DRICGAEYISDPYFSPSESLLKRYKKKEMEWSEYEAEFDAIMDQRNIRDYIKEKYSVFNEKRVCLLCSEDKAFYCHRRLVAEIIQSIFGGRIIHL